MVDKKLCPICGVEIKKANKYCSRKCYFSVPKTEEFREKISKFNKGKVLSENTKNAISKANSGKPKPWQQGENNVNYGGKYTSDPLIRQKHLKGIEERDGTWTDERKEKHSKRMSGSGNSLYGKNHSQETIEKISKAKKQQYKDGVVKVNLSKISKAEKEIANYLSSKNIKYTQQFHIKNVSFWYDFYLPDFNLIIEYQGDYWHANPNKYASGDYLKILIKGLVLVDDIWSRDAQKKQKALEANYNFVAIWESEYKIQGLSIIDNLLFS